MTTLANGLRVVSDRMEHLETLSLGVWVDAGARDETPDVMGLAHMLEHMAFKGTARRSARDIAEEVEAVGGYLNAYTGRARTAYYMRLLEQDLGLGLDLLGDVLRHSVFDAAELERERGVILQEIARALDSPEDMVHDYIQAASFPEQPVGWPILGAPGTVKTISADALRGHMARYYGPNSMVVAAAGAVDHADLVRYAEAAFGDMEPLARPARIPATFRPGARLVPGDHEQLHLAVSFQNVPFRHPSFYTSLIYSEILGGGMSSHLFQKVREERGLAYAIGAFARSFEDGGLHVIFAGTSPRNGNEVLALVAECLDGMTREVAPKEVARAKAQIRSALLMGRESPAERAETAVWDILREGQVRDAQRTVAEIDAVSPEDVMAHAAWVLGTGRPALAAVGPAESLPDYEGFCVMTARHPA